MNTHAPVKGTASNGQRPAVTQPLFTVAAVILHRTPATLPRDIRPIAPPPVLAGQGHHAAPASVATAGVIGSCPVTAAPPLRLDASLPPPAPAR